MSVLLLACVGCFLLAWIGTAALRSYALAHSVIDLPNARSSHKVPTPRGGGVAIVLTFLLALSGWHLLVGIAPGLIETLVPAGALVAVIGFWDDHRPLPARTRFAAHLAASAWAVWQLGGWPVLDLGFVQLPLGWLGNVLAALALAWAINLYNFMDGIDGLAGGQAVFLGLAGALLMWLGSADSAPFLLLAAASAGFLALNWPPARIFMGDAGSGFLGFAFGVLFLHGSSTTGSVWPWLILPGVFIVDATLTLLRRAAQGIRVTDAHRTHAYQWASRMLGAHQPVTLWVLGINMLALLPLALLAWWRPALGLSACLLAWLPLVVLAWHLKSGVPEVRA